MFRCDQRHFIWWARHVFSFAVSLRQCTNKKKTNCYFEIWKNRVSVNMNDVHRTCNFFILFLDVFFFSIFLVFVFIHFMLIHFRHFNSIDDTRRKRTNERCRFTCSNFFSAARKKKKDWSECKQDVGNYHFNLMIFLSRFFLCCPHFTCLWTKEEQKIIHNQLFEKSFFFLLLSYSRSPQRTTSIRGQMFFCHSTTAIFVVLAYFSLSLKTWKWFCFGFFSQTRNF